MIRLLFALPVAALITISLFSFMAWLVESGKNPLPDPESVLRFDVVQVEQERAAQRRQRQLPEPPKQPVTAPKTQAIQTETQSQQLSTDLPQLPNIAPSLNLNTSVSGMAIGKPGPIKLAQNTQVMPLHRIEPKYPARALKRKIQGSVVMKFSIDEKGQPTDIEVVEGNPKGVFDREALRALRQWKYQPMVVDGKATKREGQTVKLEFKLQ